MGLKKSTWCGVVGAGALLAVSFAAPALADPPDPLHGICTYAAPSCMDQNIGGNTVTPIYGNNTPSFAFDKSPNSGSFNFYLDVLIPNSVAGGNSEAFSMNCTSGCGNSSAAGGLFSTTAWTGGDLVDYLSITRANGAPPNPLSAWLGATKTLESSATGYFVYQLNFGSVTFGASTDPQFSDSFHLPDGTIIAGLAEEDVQVCHHGVCHMEQEYITTAQSSALFINCSGPQCQGRQVPEPLSLSLFGVGLLGMGALSRRRKARKAA